MKILYIINSLCGGGAEKLIKDMVPIISKKCYCEIVILFDENDKYSELLRINGIKVTKVPYKNNIKRFFFIKRYIEKGKFDIVHSHLFPSNYICAITKLLSNSKYPLFITTEHNTDNKRRHFKIFRPVEKYIYSLYDHVISISYETQACLLEWIKEDANDKYSVIYNGIDVSTFEKSIPYNKHDLYDNYKEGDIILCMIGSFTKQKNHPFVVEVMKELPHRFKLLLAGEGPLKNEIEKLVNENNLADRIFFMGFRTDVDRIIRSSDVMLIPSKWEGFGLVAVEAMACGKNVVAFDVSGLSEVLGENGFKTKAEDKNQFVKAIYTAVSCLNDRTIEYKLIQQAEKYDIELMCMNYMKLYNDLLNRK